MDRLLHTANALVSLAALATAGGPIAAAGASVTGLLSWRAIRAAAPPAPGLAAELARDMGAVLDAHCASDDQRALIPQMVEAALPDPATIIGTTLDADRLITQMQATLTDREDKQPANLALFRVTLRPALTRLLNDPDFTATLAPQFMRAVTDRLQKIAATLTELKDHYGSLARALDNLEDLRSAELEALAFRFKLTPAANASAPELLGLLRARAQEVTELEHELERLRARFPKLDNQITTAKELLEAGDTAGVRAMVRDARKVLHDAHLREGLEQDAELVEIDARALLIEGQVDEAFRVLGATADSFKAIDPLEPARRRILRYCVLLHDHGLRYGGPGIAHGLDLLAPVLSNDLRGQDAWLWSAGMNWRGIGYQEQGSRTDWPAGAALLAESVTDYRAALEVRTRADLPVDWAMTQNNLGNALRAQSIRTGRREGAALLGQAVAAFRAALEVRTRADHPVQCADTQNNLGTALSDQGERTGGAEGAVLLGQAVAAYRAALEVTTRADHPLDWAMTQNNLGAALDEQGSRIAGSEGAVLLRQALQVRTRADHPLQWAETQENLAIAEKSLAAHDSCADPTPHLHAAMAHVTAALEVFDPEHMPYNHQKTTALRDRIRAALALVFAGALNWSARRSGQIMSEAARGHPAGPARPPATGKNRALAGRGLAVGLYRGKIT